MRVSYIGEMGWEIYAHSESALRLWDVLWDAGRRAGIFPLGIGVFDSLRLEKGYRLWGPTFSQNTIHLKQDLVLR